MVRERLKAARGQRARHGLDRRRTAGARCCGSSSAPGPRSAGDPAAAQIEKGPEASGVYARVDAAGATIDAAGREGADAAARSARAAGWSPPPCFGEQAPAWIVTGTDAAGVAAAAGALTRDVLDGHFAVGVDAGRPVGVPLTDSADSVTE